MHHEMYLLNLNGDELAVCLRQLSALHEKPTGVVQIQVADGRLFMTRRVVRKGTATAELSASGHWPFPLHLKWSIFERLLLKAHAPIVKFQLFIDPKTGKSNFVADGMHLPFDEMTTQLSFELSTQMPARVEPKDEIDALLRRVQELDATNAKSGATTKEVLATVYERDELLGDLIKRIRGEACQICGHYFLTPDGRKYVECHHLEHLANEGLDCSKNILVVCANHHRQLHYGVAKILHHTSDHVQIEIDGKAYTCKL